MPMSWRPSFIRFMTGRVCCTAKCQPEVGKARLRFYRAAAVVFYRVLRLMGMSAPERM